MFMGKTRKENPYITSMERKTREDRLTEILELRKKIRLLGYDDTHTEVKRLFVALSSFVNDGLYIKDRFYITGYDKVIHVELLPRKNAQNVFLIKHHKH